MMDGVEPENNVRDDGLAAWNAHVAEVEVAAEDIVLGINRGRMNFVRGEAENLNVRGYCRSGT